MGKLVGNYIQELRQQRGISLRQLGGQLDMSIGHLSMLERGQREAAIDTLYPLVKCLNGDFGNALCLLALDAGVPEGDLPLNLA